MTFNDALWLDSERQPSRDVAVTVSERVWKYKWDAYKSLDETGKFNVL